MTRNCGGSERRFHGWTSREQCQRSRRLLVGLSDGFDGLLVGDSDDGFRLGLAEGRKEGFIDGQAGSNVGAVEGFLVGPSDGFDGLLVGESDDG